jgi:hypothetical protein
LLDPWVCATAELRRFVLTAKVIDAFSVPARERATSGPGAVAAFVIALA